MSAHEEALESHPAATPGLFVWVWVALLALTGIEVYLAYLRLEPHLMLTILMGLSVIKSALIVSYFMHLRFERLGLFLLLVPAFVFCICMFMLFAFPDSHRLFEMRPH